MMQTTWRSTSVDQEAKNSERESLTKDFIVFCKKGKTTQGNCFQMISLNDSSCLWAIGIVSSCLVTGPEWFRTGKYSLGVEELDKNSGWDDILGIGWFVYEKYVFRKIVYFLWELARLGRSSLFSAS